MIFLLILSTIEMNLYCNKDTYFIGEDILIRWEIVNVGKSVDYYGIGGVYGILLSKRTKLWDVNGREVYHGIIEGTRIGGKGGKHKMPMNEIAPGDTVRFEEVNLIGNFGSLGFAKRGFANRYIKPGEYFFSLLYRTGISDTLHFFIIEPSGKEKCAWHLYKECKREYNRAKGKEMVQYAFDILKKYPESNYVESLMRNLRIVFKVWGKYEEVRERMANITRQLLNYLEGNIEQFSNRDRTLKEALWCITYGELMLGDSREEVKNLIINMNVPLDNEIKDFLEIDE
ncbi:hypothetical protein KAX29_02465 [candidate division WOR-3 bacterium]|nr:hypothetical protein [candidate division WOR-3 bacterium]